MQETILKDFYQVLLLHRLKYPAIICPCMPWVSLGGEGYRLKLIDGYVTTPRIKSWKDKAEGSTLEKVICDYLFHRANYYSIRSDRNLEIFQSWVVGNAKWLFTELKDLLKSIKEVEQDPFYRLLIFGYKKSNVPQKSRTFLNWDSVIWDAGLTIRKKHYNLKLYRSKSLDLLKKMQEYFNSGRNPSSVLEELGLPFEFREFKR